MGQRPGMSPEPGYVIGDLASRLLALFESRFRVRSCRFHTASRHVESLDAPDPSRNLLGGERPVSQIVGGHGEIMPNRSPPIGWPLAWASVRECHQSVRGRTCPR
jgi:hypothetical protein